MSRRPSGSHWSVTDQLEEIEFDLLRAVAGLEALHRPSDGAVSRVDGLAAEELRTIGREIETAATALRRLRAELPDRRVG